MSTSSPAEFESPIDGCRPADLTPVALEAARLESTAPDALRDLKRELTRDGLVPAELGVEARFDESGSLAVQSEADRLRDAIRAGSFLGVATVRVSVATVSDPEAVEPALAACAERAAREGIELDVEAAPALER